ncbi:MAG: DEAD/DEAH box helicase [Christensenellaceae bacterium]|nr:DEAD/DEAH box helicase [Christensenellaceae bacterium]
MNFEDFNFDRLIKDAIAKKGYTTPSPIQEQAIPPALEGKDILGCAQTGTGKTCAFAVPILHKLTANQADFAGSKKIRALILTPTRELAMQIHDSFSDYGKFLTLRTGLVMGGVSSVEQIRAIKNGVDILVATPGRFIDLVWQGYADPSYVEIFVLDEADRMLDMGFLPDVRRVVEMLPQKRQTLFFSATMPPEIRKLTDSLLIDPVSVTVTPVSSTVDAIKQSVYLTDKNSKLDLLVWLLKNNKDMDSALVFSRTKYGADKIAEKLRRDGISTAAIHGNKSQGARQSALNSFKRGNVRVLVATDIAARGLDIDDISHVVNYELPNEFETYVHRIGRTGRAGKDGTAISFCDIDEKEYLVGIEKLIKKKIDVVETHPFVMTVFKKSPPKKQQQRPPRAQRA